MVRNRKSNDKDFASQTQIIQIMTVIIQIIE